VTHELVLCCVTRRMRTGTHVERRMRSDTAQKRSASTQVHTHIQYAGPQKTKTEHRMCMRRHNRQSCLCTSTYGYSSAPAKVSPCAAGTRRCSRVQRPIWSKCHSQRSLSSLSRRLSPRACACLLVSGRRERMARPRFVVRPCLLMTDSARMCVCMYVSL